MSVECYDTNNNSTITKLLEDRQKNARLHKKDYSHVFRKKSSIEILRLASLAMGIGFVYAAEQAYVAPTLLQIGVDHLTMTMVWAISPALGLLLAPLIGLICDRCRLSMGRRRPMMLVLSLGMLVGFVLLPYGRYIGQLFGEDPFSMITTTEKNNITVVTKEFATTLLEGKKRDITFAALFTILGTVLLDFNVETCQIPTRAYMLDVCIYEDHGRAIITFSALMGLGSTIAYAIGGINWESTAIGSFFGGNTETVCMIDVLISAVCFFITFTSFREIPLPLLEKDKLLLPLSGAEIKTELLKNNVFVVKIGETNDPVSNAPPMDENIEKNSGKQSLRKYLLNIVMMPKSMWILTFTQLFCWMGNICYCLHFTDFVGETVFHGDPSALIGSERNILYEDGIRFGNWGMAIFSLSSFFYSFAIEKLMVWFRTKHVYVSGIMSYAIGMLILGAWPSKIGVLLFSVTAGINTGTVYTVPFILVANYHAKSCFEVRNGVEIHLKTSRGVGMDHAIISSMTFVAQILASLSIGYLVSWMETKSAILYAASGASVCSAITAMYVLYI